MLRCLFFARLRIAFSKVSLGLTVAFLDRVCRRFELLSDGISLEDGVSQRPVAFVHHVRVGSRVFGVLS